MMQWLVGVSLRLPLVVLGLACLLLVAGAQLALRMPVDVFPEFAPPLVEVQTEAAGLSAEEVESLVTVPLENAFNGIPHLKTIRSKSVAGLSSVTLIFPQGTDLLQDRQLVQERLSGESGRLPAVARAPVILPPLSSMSRILKIGVSSKKLSQMDLTDLARWTVRPRLMSIPGVANVAIWGQRDRQLRIIIDPVRLRVQGVALDAVVRAAGEEAAVTAGGFVDTPNQRLAVRHYQPATTPEEVARTVVEFRNGAAVRIGDVADVVEGSPPPIGDAIINGGPGLLLIVEKQPWGNTLDVTRAVEGALEALRPGLRDVDIDPTIFRPATFIERSLDQLRRSMWIGCVLVVAVIAVFLFEWRASLISALAIPLSLMGAAVVLFWQGVTINTMVLAGLAIAIGEVVDDAIIDVENISRRLRLNRAAGSPLSSFRVVLDASLEVRSSVVYASWIVILVFLPIFFLDGLAGSFFRPLAYSYVLAILASLLVALTVTPALCLLLLPRSGAAAGAGPADPPLARWLRKRYRALLPGIIRRPELAMAIIAGMFIATLAAIPFLGEEFLPSFKETDFLMHWVEKPGTSLDAMRRSTLLVSRDLRSIPGVRNFGAHLGRAEVADEVVGPNFTELWISVDAAVDHDATVSRIREVINRYPGLYHDVLTYLKERIKEVLTGAGATLVVRIFGEDLETLRGLARQVQSAIRDIPGVVDLKVEQQIQIPHIGMKVDLRKAAVFGLTSHDVRRSLSILLQGQKVGEIYRDQKSVDLVVAGSESLRQDPYALRRALIDSPLGSRVPLEAVADIFTGATPNEIRREGASRRIDVTCNISGRDLGGVARDIQKKIGAMSFPQAYHPEVLGEHGEREASRRKLLGLAGFSLLGILLLLHADFRSARLVALIALTLPFALFGGVAAALASGGVLSLGSLIGFITVLGIAARNAILLVSHYRHLEETEGVVFGEALVLQGAEERLAPILMTALCAGLALLPIAWSGQAPGLEIEHPMTVVILGGLATSTCLNLFLLPALYARFGGKKPRLDG